MKGRDKEMRKILAVLLILSLMITLSTVGACAAEQPREYMIEENTAEDKTIYPYVVHTEFATWYLSKDDIDLMGKDAFFEGLREVLQYQEADFADARAALAGFLRKSRDCRSGNDRSLLQSPQQLHQSIPQLESGGSRTAS